MLVFSELLDWLRLSGDKNRVIDMKFEIRKTKNGLIFKVIDNENEEEVVYQEKYDEEVECFADFLRYINDEYGPSTSRYSEKRIYITVEPGDKHESAT